MDLCVKCDGFARAIAIRSSKLRGDAANLPGTSQGCPLCGMISDYLDMLDIEAYDPSSDSIWLRYRSLESNIADENEPLSAVNLGGIRLNIWSRPGKPRFLLSI